jgi:predicted RNase H-like nuclease (RuvC/YqgF family)
MQYAMQTAPYANDIMQHIIVGIDPGKTAAIACLDLNGRELYLSYGRFVGVDWFVDKIKSIGVPIIIASDKKNSSSMVDKIAAIFGCQVFSPSRDISTAKKKEFISASYNAENLHERDALAAAMTAYYAYANKLKQAERIAREKGINDVDKVKSMVVKRYSINEAILNKKSGRKR